MNDLNFTIYKTLTKMNITGLIDELELDRVRTPKFWVESQQPSRKIIKIKKLGFKIE